MPTSPFLHSRKILLLFGVVLAFLAGSPAPGGPREPAPKEPRIQTSGGRLERIRARGSLIVALQRDYHPFHVESPRPGLPGIDVELAQLLGETLQVKVEYRFLSLAGILEAAAQGEVDVAFGGISSSLKRARHVNFTLPYLVTTPAALLSKEVLPPDSESVDFPRREFKSLSDLKYLGRITIGVSSGTTNEAILREVEEFKKHTIETFPNRAEALAALRARKVDAFVADGVFINSLIRKDPALLSGFLPLTGRFRDEHICMALTPGDPEFWNYLNFFIREARRSGRVDGILKKYLEGGDWIPKEP